MRSSWRGMLAQVTAMPLGGSGSPYTTMIVEDHPRAERELPVSALWPQAGVGYFDAIGIPLLGGLAFQPGRGGDAFPGRRVGRAFADKWWPGTSPLGRRMRLRAENEDWYEIVD